MKQMTLGEYFAGFQQFVKDNPDLKDTPIFYSIDDEGNGYNPIYYHPGVMETKDVESYLISLSPIPEKVVCIN